jgi:hypothetical protein
VIESVKLVFLGSVLILSWLRPNASGAALQSHDMIERTLPLNWKAAINALYRHAVPSRDAF